MGGVIIYNLFSNAISPKPEYLSKFKAASFRWGVITYIKQQVKIIIELQEVLVYYKLLNEIYEICENVRNDNLTLAHEIYTTLLNELTYWTYTNLAEEKSKTAFCESLDFTEIYYNLGKLKWDSGDYDNALLYVVHADVGYSKHNLKPRGTFIRFLLNSRGYVLWNAIPYLVSDFSSCNLLFNNSNIKSIIGKDITENLIIELLKDFEMLLLLQFIKSFYRYHNFKDEKSNEYKALREFRILGDLTWLFECYLKDKFKVEGKQLYNLIQEHLFANKEEYKRQFENYNNLDVPGKENKYSKKYYEESLAYMLKELKTNKNPVELASICIRITYLFRNYSAHYIDERFFSTENYSKELYICILSSFIVAYTLII